MFCNSQGPIPAMGFAMPDVCLTPFGPVITPVPYPNMSMSPTAIPNQFSVLIMGMPAHNLGTVRPITMGDQPGVNLSPLSGTEMASGTDAMGSTNLLIGGPPSTKMTMPTRQNLTAAFGTGISPSQTVMMALR